MCYSIKHDAWLIVLNNSKFLAILRVSLEWI